jgi:hypothetical protein
MDKRLQNIVENFGEDICLDAYAMSEGGEGAWTVGDCLNIVDKNGDVNVRRTDNIIDAGRAIMREALA